MPKLALSLVWQTQLNQITHGPIIWPTPPQAQFQFHQAQTTPHVAQLNFK